MEMSLDIVFATGPFLREGGRDLFLGWPLVSGTTRRVRKLTLLSGNRYFEGSATFGTLQYYEDTNNLLESQKIIPMQIKMYPSF